LNYSIREMFYLLAKERIATAASEM